MIRLSAQIPDLDEWVESHDVGGGETEYAADFGRGMRWGVGLSLLFWAAFAVGVVSC